MSTEWTERRSYDAQRSSRDSKNVPVLGSNEQGRAAGSCRRVLQPIFAVVMEVVMKRYLVKIQVLDGDFYVECKYDYTVTLVEALQPTRIRSRIYVERVECDYCGRIIDPYFNN